MPLACIHTGESFIFTFPRRLNITLSFSAGFGSTACIFFTHYCRREHVKINTGPAFYDSRGRPSTSLPRVFRCPFVFLSARDIDRLGIEVQTSASGLNRIRSGKALGWKEQKENCISMITFAFLFCQCDICFPGEEGAGKNVSRPHDLPSLIHCQLQWESIRKKTEVSEALIPSWMFCLFWGFFFPVFMFLQGWEWVSWLSHSCVDGDSSAAVEGRQIPLAARTERQTPLLLFLSSWQRFVGVKMLMKQSLKEHRYNLGNSLNLVLGWTCKFMYFLLPAMGN